jgi:hypothetical protein
MTRYEYDEGVSSRLHMEVVHEIDDQPVPVARWVGVMRRLNSVEDLLARRVFALQQVEAIPTAGPNRLAVLAAHTPAVGRGTR